MLLEYAPSGVATLGTKSPTQVLLGMLILLLAGNPLDTDLRKPDGDEEDNARETEA